jgi:MSHA biogenesis protein MshM
MYLTHFGLQEPPFSITPDTSFFFPYSDYQEALNTLLIAVRNGEGFIKITGEVGTGKTLLCRQFLASINGDAGGGEMCFVTAYIPNPYLEPRTLLLALAEEVGLELEKDADQYHLLKSLTHALLDFANAGKRVVLCLDEAQAMPLESLEAIRLLSNLETEKRKLLQIVLFGQPELNQKLQQESIRQLNQRITFHYHLGPLRREDMDYYLAHRLRVAKFSGGQLFSRPAVRQLYAASGGIPRLVNILAHKALMLTYGEGRQQVGARHVRAAAKDTEAARKSSWYLRGLTGSLMDSAGAVLLWMGLR